MVEFDSNKPDRQEERRTEEQRTEQRRILEKKMQTEPMKTFEAKLSEKTAKEKAEQESVNRQLHNLKESKEDKKSFLERIIGVAKEKDAQKEKSQVEGSVRYAQDAFKKKDKVQNETDNKAEESKESEKEEGAGKTQKKQGETSAEGHKRVAEKEGQEQGGSGGGSGQGKDGDSAGGQQSFDQGSQSQQHRQKNPILKGTEGQPGTVGAVAKQSSFSSGGFQQNARSFSPENLDEIVSSIQLGVNQWGEEEFSVELTDDYFEGLKVQATRTEEGVVLKFVCPNLSVRSTFLKFRPTVYLHLKRKNINVFRVDVV